MPDCDENPKLGPRLSASTMERTSVCCTAVNSARPQPAEVGQTGVSKAPSTLLAVKWTSAVPISIRQHRSTELSKYAGFRFMIHEGVSFPFGCQRLFPRSGQSKRKVISVARSFSDNRTQNMDVSNSLRSPKPMQAVFETVAMK
jgi:hypothetical protein